MQQIYKCNSCFKTFEWFDAYTKLTKCFKCLIRYCDKCKLKRREIYMDFPISFCYKCAYNFLIK